MLYALSVVAVAAKLIRLPKPIKPHVKKGKSYYL